MKVTINAAVRPAEHAAAGSPQVRLKLDSTRGGPAKAGHYGPQV
jgi:hypothetical protein